MPLVWQVLAHSRSRVAYDGYQEMLEQAVEWLPVGCTVVLTADRGFADPPLMAPLTRRGWHGRRRIKGSCWIDRHGQRRGQVHRIPVSAGQALFWPHVDLTQQRYGPVHLALGRPQDSQAYWLVVSDEPTEAKTCEAYGRRFDSAEHFLDDTSHGFQLESSLSRSATGLERWCGVLAITTLSLVSPGTEVAAQGTRRWVDAHGFRGLSSLKIGWNWVKLALRKGYEITTSLHVSGEADPEPAMASQSPHQKPPQLFFVLEFQNAVA